MELAFSKRGFHHDLNMRLATEIQDETTQPYRVAEPTAQQSHEIPTDSAHGQNEISQHLALAAEATNDAVRVWSVTNGTLSWPQGLYALLGYSASPATDDIGF